MDNEEVARYLLERLPRTMEGVVYLDRHDRKMILLRASRHCPWTPSLPLTLIVGPPSIPSWNPNLYPSLEP